MLFTRAAEVEAGQAITSAQYNSLVAAFNDRLRSGIGDEVRRRIDGAQVAPDGGASARRVRRTYLRLNELGQSCVSHLIAFFLALADDGTDRNCGCALLQSRLKS